MLEKITMWFVEYPITNLLIALALFLGLFSLFARHFQTRGSRRAFALFCLSCGLLLGRGLNLGSGSGQPEYSYQQEELIPEVGLDSFERVVYCVLACLLSLLIFNSGVTCATGRGIAIVGALLTGVMMFHLLSFLSLLSSFVIVIVMCLLIRLLIYRASLNLSP